MAASNTFPPFAHLSRRQVLDLWHYLLDFRAGKCVDPDRLSKEGAGEVGLLNL